MCLINRDSFDVESFLYYSDISLLLLVLFFLVMLQRRVAVDCYNVIYFFSSFTVRDNLVDSLERFYSEKG